MLVLCRFTNEGKLMKLLCAVLLLTGASGMQLVANQAHLPQPSSSTAGTAGATVRILPKKKCCPCMQRWAYSQQENPSFRLVEGQRLHFQLSPDLPIDAYVSVQNVSSSPVKFGVRIDTTRKNLLHKVNFCIGQACYPSFVVESMGEEGYVTLQPGEADHTFKLQFDPQGHSGQSVIGVVIYNVANLSDYITFDVTFDATTLSVDQSRVAVTIAPNPASDVVVIQGSVGAQVEVVDVVGRVVRTVHLGAERGMLSVADLPPGAYRVVVRQQTQVMIVPLQVVR